MMMKMEYESVLHLGYVSKFYSAINAVPAGTKFGNVMSDVIHVYCVGPHVDSYRIIDILNNYAVRAVPGISHTLRSLLCGSLLTFCI